MGNDAPPFGETISAEAEVKPVEEEEQPAGDNAAEITPAEGIVTITESPGRKFARATRVVTPREEVKHLKEASLKEGQSCSA